MQQDLTRHDTERELTSVRLLAVPVALHRASSEAHDALMREFALVAADADVHPDAVPYRLIRLEEELRGQYDEFSAAQLAALENAFTGGQAQLDLEYRVPPSLADAARRLRDLLHEADEYCREGADLLTVAPGPELVAYRDWLLLEFIEQIEQGRAPRPWQGAPATVAAPEQPAQHRRQGVSRNGTGPNRRTDTVGRTGRDGTPRGEIVLTLRGAIDLESAPRIRSSVTRLRRQGASSIVLDLTEVDFVDSVGLGLLVSIQRRLGEEQRTLALSNVGTAVRQTIDIAGLEQVLSIR